MVTYYTHGSILLTFLAALILCLPFSLSLSFSFSWCLSMNVFTTQENVLLFFNRVKCTCLTNKRTEGRKTVHHTHSFRMVTIENNARNHDIFTRNQLDTFMLFNINLCFFLSFGFGFDFDSTWRECLNARHIVAKYGCFAVAATTSAHNFFFESQK